MEVSGSILFVDIDRALRHGGPPVDGIAVAYKAPLWLSMKKGMMDRRAYRFSVKFFRIPVNHG
jgi:hypothetical protein